MNEINLHFGKVGACWLYVFRMAIILLSAAVLSGCMSIWKEPVRIGNGEVITVTRVAKYEGAGGIGESCWFCRLYWSKIAFDYAGRHYVWTSRNGSTSPIILDVLDGKPVVVSIYHTGMCRPSSAHDSGVSFYTFSTFENDEWSISTKIPEGIVRMTNLLPANPDSYDAINEAGGKDAFISSIRLWGGKPNWQAEIVPDAEKHCANRR